MHKHSVESNKRASRRHNAEVLKKRYKKYTTVADPNDDKRVGKALQCPKACSCHMCCNDRRNPYAKKERETLQERVHPDILAADMDYYECYRHDPDYEQVERFDV